MEHQRIVYLIMNFWQMWGSYRSIPDLASWLGNLPRRGGADPELVTFLDDPRVPDAFKTPTFLAAKVSPGRIDISHRALHRAIDKMNTHGHEEFAPIEFGNAADLASDGSNMPELKRRPRTS